MNKISPPSVSLHEMTRVIVVVALATCGCQPPSSSTAVPPSNTTTSKPATGGSPKAPPDATFPKELPQPKIDQKIYKVTPKGQQGWTAQTSPLDELGKKVDEALDGLEHTWGMSDAVFEVDGASMQTKMDLKIENNRKFSLDFFLPQTEGTRNRIVADGSERSVFFEGKWESRPFATSHLEPFTAERVQRWPKDFYRQMLASFEYDTPVWSSLFAAWDKKVGGYSAFSEKKTIDVGGAGRDVYRVVASEPKSHTEVEVIVDGIKYLPLTVRSTMPDGKGGVNRRFWTCKWAGGGSFGPNDFNVPKKP